MIRCTPICERQKSCFTAYFASDTYISISNSQRERKLHTKEYFKCVNEVSPRCLNPKQWALYPTSYYNRNYSKHKISCAHAYITRNETNRTICSHFYLTDEHELRTVCVSTFEALLVEHDSNLPMKKDEIILFKDLLLTANKNNSLFSVTYFTHVFVFDARGTPIYHINSSKKPEAMCLNINNDIIPAKFIEKMVAVKLKS